MSERRIKNRLLTRQNAKLGKSMRKEIQENGLNLRDECGVLDPTAAAAFRNIAYPERRKKIA